MASKLRGSRHRLRVETLETRRLLAVDTMAIDTMAMDVNRDGEIAATDAIAVINRIGTEHFETDVNGDGIVAALDVHSIINQLITRDPQQAANYGETDGDDHINVIGDDAHEIQLFATPSFLEREPRIRGFGRGTIEESGDVDVLRFTLAQADVVELDVRAFSRVDNGVAVRLFDADGIELAVGSSNDRLVVDVDAGDYFIEISADDGESTGRYGIWMKMAGDFADLADDHSDQIGDATRLEFWSLFRQQLVATRGALNDAGDLDVFQFSMSENDTLKIFSASRVDIDIQISDADGNVIYEGEQFDYDRIDLTAGEYFVTVSAADGVATGYYGLTLRI